MPGPYGQSAIIRDQNHGYALAVDSQGRITVNGVLLSGDIQIGVIQLSNGDNPGEVNVYALPSGDYGILVIPSEVNPLHRSQANPTVTLNYNASGDLISIDKIISGITYRQPVSDTTYTGGGVIVNTKRFSSYYQL